MCAKFLRDTPLKPITAVSKIPYLTREGERRAIQYRLTLEEGEGVPHFKWRSGDTPILYGLWRLDEWCDADTL